MIKTGQIKLYSPENGCGVVQADDDSSTPVAPQLHPAPLNSRKGGHKSLRPRALPAGFIAPCLPELSHAAAIGGRLISSVPILQFPMLLAMAALISAFAASG
jgi:hypothetical protein